MLHFPFLCRLMTLFLLARVASAKPGGSMESASSTQNSLVDVIAAHSNLTTLANVIKSAPLFTENFCKSEMSETEVTAFAPSDDAFASFDVALLAWEAHWQDVLLFHIAQGAAVSTDLVDGMQLTMLNEEVVTVNTENGTVVLTSRNTVGSLVVQANTFARNGVVHVVDSLLLPAWTSRNLFALLTSDDEPASDKFSIFGELLIVLSGAAGLFVPAATVFAPTNAAFEALGEETLAFYRNPNNTEALYGLLTNHVVVGMLMPSSGLVDAQVIKTDSLELVVSISGDEVMLNNATIVKADILARDGIVHAVDTVFIVSMMPTKAINGMSTGAFIGIIIGCLAIGGMACFAKRQQRQNKPKSVPAVDPPDEIQLTATSVNVVVVSPAVGPSEEIQHHARRVLPDYKDQVRGAGCVPAPLAQAVVLHGSVDAARAVVLHGSVDAEDSSSILVEAEDTSSILWLSPFHSQAAARSANN